MRGIHNIFMDSLSSCSNDREGINDVIKVAQDVFKLEL